MNETKKCPVCSNPISGRSDKKFCNSYCRSAYHYRQKKPTSMYFMEVDKQLRLNRKIIKHFNQKGLSLIRKEIILSQGYNPRFYTHKFYVPKQGTYYFCYDQGVLKDSTSQMHKHPNEWLLVSWNDLPVKM